MNHFRLLLLVLTLSGVSHALPVHGQTGQRTVSASDPKISVRLRDALAMAGTVDPLKVWIYLADKGLATAADITAAVDAAEARLTDRARRRIEARGGGRPGLEDVPVHPPYLDGISEAGGVVHQVSRWLNAVSVSAPPGVIQRLAELPFVLRIEPVARMRRPPPRPGRTEPPVTPRMLGPDRKLGPDRAARLDYGRSLTQLNQLQVPELHDLGLTGRGVLVGVLDTGFELEHVAFDTLKTRVEAQRNFILEDAPYRGFADVDHGTAVLSVIGGYAPGHLIGPSYGASYLLASTEAITFERQIEEDWWVAGLEWADSLGAEVVTSSLGYSDWYAYSDMDGTTAVTTRAATMAVRRGIVVVNAMGNMGGEPYEKMAAPADGEGVISVGGVDADGQRVSFSSVGPTYDGRLKPDVMAMGEGVYQVDTKTIEGYRRGDGTSYAAPLVAGVAALLLEAHPRWTPDKVLQVLRRTASQAAAPDTLAGFGIVQALDAYRNEPSDAMTGPGAGSGPPGPSVPGAFTTALHPNAPNPFDGSTHIRFELAESARVSISIYDLLGRRVRTLDDEALGPGRHVRVWNGLDDAGRAVPSGVYFCRLSAGDFVDVEKMLLMR